MSDTIRVHTWEDGFPTVKIVATPRKTSAERRKAPRLYGWSARYYIDGKIGVQVAHFGFFLDVPDAWANLIDRPNVRKAELLRSHRHFDQYNREG